MPWLLLAILGGAALLLSGGEEESAASPISGGSGMPGSAGSFAQMVNDLDEAPLSAVYGRSAGYESQLREIFRQSDLWTKRLQSEWPALQSFLAWFKARGVNVILAPAMDSSRWDWFAPARFSDKDHHKLRDGRAFVIGVQSMVRWYPRTGPYEQWFADFRGMVVYSDSNQRLMALRDGFFEEAPLERWGLERGDSYFVVRVADSRGDATNLGLKIASGLFGWEERDGYKSEGSSRLGQQPTTAPNKDSNAVTSSVNAIKETGETLASTARTAKEAAETAKETAEDVSGAIEEVGSWFGTGG